MRSSLLRVGLVLPIAITGGCAGGTGGGAPGFDTGLTLSGGTSQGDSTGSGDDGSGSASSGVSDTEAATKPGAPRCAVQGQKEPPNCGDGLLTSDEACDDGNREAGDGCAADCLCTEPGYSCANPGKPCHPIAKCGDGLVVLPEQCDDGNDENDDGCSSRCKIELGSKCDGSPSVCEDTTCGDGKKEGAEACDDGNELPYDGCSSTCQAEPDCTAGMGCTSECGDGLIIEEECDDGNSIDGDGCSKKCEVERGFNCGAADSCEKVNGACTMTVPAIYRDFIASHSDFAVGCDGLQRGGVEELLDENGKPVRVAGQLCESTNFQDWYVETNDNATILGTITLFDDGKGGFVNRWGPKGEKWKAYTNPQWAANTVGECQANGCVPCPWDAKVGCTATVVEYDGNPFFFPLDDVDAALPDTKFNAKVGPAYGYPSWPFENTIVPGAGMHNFFFTTEVVYWFTYDASKKAKLDFTGDDDVWVFINGHLAVDLGGVHVPLDASVTVDAATADDFGLEDGRVYPIHVFHAERKVEGSSFRLTLQGFQTSRSDCGPVCGDGIIGLGEECDDGENDGGYGECGPDCKLGEYCGDAIVQEDEDCDDGNAMGEGDECPDSCRIIYTP